MNLLVHAPFPKLRFSILVKYLFGEKEQVFLKPCIECGDFKAVYQVKTVFVDTKAIPVLKNKFPNEWRQLVRFFIAHELSHFVHEKITLLESGGLSPQGNYTLVRESPFNNFPEMLKKDGPNGIFRFVVRSSKSHLEVDGLALIALMNLGFNDVEPAYRWLKMNSDKSISLFRIDTSRRAEGIRSAFVLPQGRDSQQCSDLQEDAEIDYWINLPG